MNNFPIPDFSEQNSFSTNAMVSTMHPLASQIAIDVLKRGGHAVDAALSAAFILSIIYPFACGPGSDLVALCWDNSKGHMHGLLALSSIPDNVLKNWDENSKSPELGPLSMGIPGTVSGWFDLHQKFGKLPLDQLMSPAIYYSNAGIPVPEMASIYWKSLEEKLMLWDTPSKIYLRGDRGPHLGEIFRNPSLSRTFKMLAQYGKDIFYRGAIAHSLVNDLRSLNSTITFEDFTKYKSKWVKPEGITHSAHEIWSLIHPIAILDKQYNTKPNIESNLKRNSSSEQTVSMDDYVVNPPEATLPRAHTGVVINIIDRELNTVSLVMTNYSPFGSGLTSEQYGFAMNNALASCSKTQSITFPYTPILVTKDGVLKSIMVPSTKSTLIEYLSSLGINNRAEKKQDLSESFLLELIDETKRIKGYNNNSFPNSLLGY